MGAIELFQDCSSAELSYQTCSHLKDTHLLRSSCFHFLGFYSVTSLTGRFQASALEEDVHEELPLLEKDHVKAPWKATIQNRPWMLRWFFQRDFGVPPAINFDNVHTLILISVRELQIMLRKYLSFCSVVAWVGCPSHPSWPLMAMPGILSLQNSADRRDTTSWLITDTVLMDAVLRESRTAKTGYFFSPRYL